MTRPRTNRFAAALAMAAAAAAAARAAAVAAVVTLSMAAPAAARAAGEGAIVMRASTHAEREEARRYLQAAATPASGAASAPVPAEPAVDVWREAQGRPDGWHFAMSTASAPLRSPEGVCHVLRQRHERASARAPWQPGPVLREVWLARGRDCVADDDRVTLEAAIDEHLLAGLLRDEQRWLDRSRALIQGAETCGHAWRCEAALTRIGRPWVLGPWRPDDLELRYDGGDCPGASVVLRPLKGELTPWAAFCAAPTAAQLGR